MKWLRVFDGFVLVALYRVTLAAGTLTMGELGGIWGDHVQAVTMPLFVAAAIAAYGLVARAYFYRCHSGGSKCRSCSPLSSS